ncbi:hypothetical protein EJB05_28354 [Eragrostis curvula]|uniref:DNA-directed RNA polymerase RBP11-like dimerisation domain-containing protein n=1 Tax=Eragrostis curvula TaxID=38414 RepID=A0A5J9UR34_9POAL|nr:hypothetical protein EJB05_28354 [Eragrostis curvula]
MEHGSVTDSSASTFSIVEEDHTLANSVRFVLNQDSFDECKYNENEIRGGVSSSFDFDRLDIFNSSCVQIPVADHDFYSYDHLKHKHDSPRVAFCGYSIPHPADNKVNIRVQTTGDPAKDVLKDSLQDLMVMCQHIRGTFDNAVADYRSNKPAEPMDVDPKQK